MLFTAVTALFITYYAAVDQELHRWFEGLRSDAGGYCCAETDGIKIDDPDWGKDDSGYWVVVNGERTPVPAGAVIHQRHPKVNYAVVWKQYIDGKPVVRCFLPGPET